MSQELDPVFQLIGEANEIFASPNLGWMEKYNQVFGLEIFQQIHGLGYTLDYYDPDGSWREDVTAYVEALNDFRKRMQNVHSTKIQLSQQELDAIRSMIENLLDFGPVELSEHGLVAHSRRYNVADEKEFVEKCKALGLHKS